ncbi:hypothetical protein ACP275_06G036200 [Erythranthe tilingii]
MAKNTKKVGGSSSQWTNERHVDFLNSMEASFVQTMLENNGRFPRLDRYLPDTADSTVDLGKERRRRHSASDIVEPSARRTDTKGRILSCQDQVVPQFQNKRDDDKDKD